MPPFPSDISYVKLSDPLLNPAFGVYLTVPLGFILAVPFAGWTVILLTEIVSPSKSSSFDNTGISIATPGSVPAESLLATGASFIGVTVIFNVLFAAFVPSLTVYVTCGTDPL